MRPRATKVPRIRYKSQRMTIRVEKQERRKVKLVNRNVERGLRGSQEHLVRELETDNVTEAKLRQIKTLFSFIGLQLKPVS